MARDNRRPIDRIVVEAGDALLVGHAGMLAFVQWCVRKGILMLIAKRLPAAGSTGYPAEDMLLTLWVAVLLRGSQTVLETIDALRRNAGLVALLGMAFGVFLLVRRFFVGPESEGVFTLFAILFVFVGILILAVGFVGEYVGRIYLEVRRRPTYRIRAIHQRAR